MSDHSLEDRRALRAAQRNARIAEAQDAETLKWIMSTPAGRQWMHNLLATCHIGVTPFTGDNDRTNFQCGEQNVGIRIWAQLQSTCPDLYLAMMQEQQQKEIANATGRTSAQLDGSPNGDWGVEGPGEYFDADGNHIHRNNFPTEADYERYLEEHGIDAR